MRSLRQDKGVAGLNVLLSVVVLLFLIGFLVFIFAIMGGELEDQTRTDTAITFTNVESGTVCGNDTGCYINSYFEAGEYNFGMGSFVITNCTNNTDSSLLIHVANYTVSTTEGTIGLITNATTAETDLVNFKWNCSGTFSYDANNTATDVMSDVSGSIAGVTDWFTIIIVITAMLVLILLTVLIISAISGSGLVGGGLAGGKGKAPTTSA